MFWKLFERHTQIWQRNQIEKHCDEVQNIYQQMRTLRHDYKNHLQVMRAYLELEEYEKLGEYISHLDEEIAQVETLIRTGNVMLDAILNSKISLAQSKNILVNAKVVLPPDLAVKEYDLCTILGNLLDNAIEGCETQKEGERFVRIYIGVVKDHLYLSVTNSHETKMQKENGQYRSTKSSGRGIGTISIDSAVKKYGGYVNRQNDEMIFATEIMLPLCTEKGADRV